MKNLRNLQTHNRPLIDFSSKQIIDHAIYQQLQSRYELGMIISINLSFHLDEELRMYRIVLHSIILLYPINLSQMYRYVFHLPLNLLTGSPLCVCCKRLAILFGKCCVECTQQQNYTRFNYIHVKYL